MRGRVTESMLACGRACCLYLNRLGFTRITQTHLTCRGHSCYAPLHQNSSNMGDSNPVNKEVEQFNRRSLKKTETHEKNHLPTKEEIDEEKKAAKEVK